MKTIIGVIFLVFTIIIGLSIIEKGDAYLDNLLFPTSSTSNEESSFEDEETVIVTLSGEVLNPGKYEIEKGYFLNDAIVKAGGVTTSADVNCFDYYLMIDKDINIYIPKITEEIKISINEGDIDELTSLTGIGKILAERIIEYRELSPFLYLEEIMNVEGIGKSIFFKIKDNICL